METQNTTNQKQQSSPAYSKVVFIEYASAKKGQHFITVMGRPDGRKQIIGRIFKEYDKENKKYMYTAADREGKSLFESTPNLYELKKQFIENEKNLAPDLPLNKEEKAMAQAADQVDKDMEKLDRGDELENVRKAKKEKSKGQELER
jgi:hypothetical protein